MRQIHVFFKGQVQGVGFRYTTQSLAHVMKLGGWVRNLRDGRVEMVAQGEEERLQEFLQRLQNGPLHDNIEEVECRWSENEQVSPGFEVRPTL
jgi:acylphosphatase